MTEVRVRIVSMGIFWFEARVSHIPRAKSVLAMVAKAGAVQLARSLTAVGVGNAVVREGIEGAPH